MTVRAASRGRIGRGARRGLLSACLLAGACLVSLPRDLAGQHAHQGGHEEEPSPYAGDEGRGIKALSAEEVRQLLAGEGMGLARVAELNGVPGPLHTLELAEELALSPEQRDAVRRLFDEMRAAAIPLGERIVALERDLDGRFRSGAVSPTELGALTREIARLQGELRAVHLLAHLRTAPLLTEPQVEAYARLRGYASGAPTGGPASSSPSPCEK